MSLLSALEKIGIHPKQTANNVHKSPCPWCKGDDRFHVFTDQDNDRYWCRKCDKSGDEIQFYRDYHGLSFPAAARKADQGSKIRDTRQTKHTNRTSHKRTFSLSQENIMTDNEWISTSQLWRKIMEDRLIFPSMEYLKHHEHGILKSKRIESDTSSSLKIGYNLKHFHIALSELRAIETEPPPNTKTLAGHKWYLLNGAKISISQKGIWIPQGIVIPYYRDGMLQSIKVRLDNPLGDTKIRYAAIKGGREICFALYASQFGKENPGFPWMIVESELDAILIFQEASDLINVAALRSISNMPDKKTLEAIGNQEIIFVPDNEMENGSFKNQKQVNKWYETFGSRMHIWLTSNGSKDPSDMAAKFKKNPIRSWVKSAIHKLLLRHNDSIQKNEILDDSSDLESAERIVIDGELQTPGTQIDGSNSVAQLSSFSYHSEGDSNDEDIAVIMNPSTCYYVSDTGSDPITAIADEDSQHSDRSDHQKTSILNCNQMDAPWEYQHNAGQSYKNTSEPIRRKIIDPYQQAVWNKKAEEYQEHLKIWKAYYLAKERVSRIEFINKYILPVVGKISLANRTYFCMESLEYIKEIDGVIYPDIDPALLRGIYDNKNV